MAASGFGREGIAAIGLGIPGKVDPERGLGVLSVNLGWRNVPVRDRLQAAFGLPCVVENDVKAGALGEWRFGAGAGLRNLAYLVVGTGIAAGLILDGRLYRGTAGMAGEIGHAIINREGTRCKCGGRGCLEAEAAGPAIAAHAQAKPADGLSTYDAAGSGGQMAPDALEAAAGELALAIQWLIMAFDPQAVLLGGGVAQAGEVVLQAIRRRLQRMADESYVFREVYAPQMVRLGGLGKDAGLLGAAALVAPDARTQSKG